MNTVIKRNEIERYIKDKISYYLLLYPDEYDTLEYTTDWISKWNASPREIEDLVNRIERNYDIKFDKDWQRYGTTIYDMANYVLYKLG